MIAGLPKYKAISELKIQKAAIYQTIYSLYREHSWAIGWMCNVLGISRASYYKWLNRKPKDREKENQSILQTIIEVDKKYKHLYGSYRMKIAVNKALKTQYNQKRIARIMCVHDIKSVFRKKRNRWKKVSPQMTAQNELKRIFEAKRPNEKWCTDVTEVKIPGRSTKLYISSILDLYDRYPVGYSISERNSIALVDESLDEALKTHTQQNTLLHSDRGFQYTRKPFNLKLAEHGISQSMSRVGHCIDNGPMEGFQGIMKDELFILFDITNEDECKRALKKYMDFYIYERPQKRYQGKTPDEVRRVALSQAVPQLYPIPTNRKIQTYWNKIADKQKKGSAILL